MSKLDREEEGLERFALGAHAYGRLTGASLAMHAIPDAFLVLHTGVGCKYKGAGQFTLHDITRAVHHGEGHTEVTDRILVKGSAERIPVYLRSWYKKRTPAFMGVVASSFLEMAGEDLAAAAAEGAATVPCPVAYVRTLGFDGDLYDGYCAVALEVLRRVPFRKTRPSPGTVGVIGYFFDRYEQDHAANLQQIRFLIDSLGLKCGPIHLSGRPYAELMELARCERLILLPYGARYADEIARLSGRPVLRTGLPVGLSGSARWLRDVGKGFAIPRSRVEAAIRMQSAYARPMLDSFKDYVRERVASRRVAIFADLPLAVGLTSLMLDLGLSPALIGIRGQSLGGQAAFVKALSRTGTDAPADLKVLENPSLRCVARETASLWDESRLAFVLGSHSEISYIRDSAREIPHVEIGFPSTTHHVLFPTPFYGVAGSLALAQRIINLKGIRGNSDWEA